MTTETKVQDDAQIYAWLRRHGINPTSQRVKIARAFFSRCVHLSAEDVFVHVNANGRCVSKATVYNTLSLFVHNAVIRQVTVDPSKIFYDSNTAPHHHFYDVDTGELTDIDADRVEISGLPRLPAGAILEGVDVIVRLRRSQ